MAPPMRRLVGKVNPTVATAKAGAKRKCTSSPTTPVSKTTVSKAAEKAAAVKAEPPTPKGAKRARTDDLEESVKTAPPLSKKAAKLEAAKRAAAAAGAAAALAAKAKAAADAPSPDRLAEETSRLQRALQGLHPGGWAGRLPCREQEQAQISSHLRKAVKQGGTSQVLYISGMPGAGKTASLMNTVKQLAGDRSLSKIAIVHINAMRLGSPNAVFAEINSQIRSQLPPGREGALSPASASSSSAGVAGAELTGFFEARESTDPIVLLLIDEIDYLVTRTQAVLYRVFTWLSLPKPRLVVATISNTFDLPERLLPRVASRFGIVRVDYPPYHRDQIVRILHERLETHEALGTFTPLALRLCAARVAAASGDIRKALQLCSRAIEVRLEAAQKSGSVAAGGAGGVPNRGPVDQKHLEVAERELLRTSPAALAIAGLSRRPRRLLTALLLELRQREVEVAPLPSVTKRYSRLMGAAAAGDDDDEQVPSVVAAAAQKENATTTASSTTTSLLESLSGHAEDEVAFLVRRLEGMALLRAHSAGADEPGGRTLELGECLDRNDLAAALESGEDHSGILQLIRDARA